MKIVLDVMGGDLAPSAPVLGAIQALKKTRSETQIVLIGNQEVIDKSLDGFTSPMSLLTPLVAVAVFDVVDLKFAN